MLNGLQVRCFYAKTETWSLRAIKIIKKLKISRLVGMKLNMHHDFKYLGR